MAVEQPMPADVQYIVGLMTSPNLYINRHAAFAPSLALSAANGNAPIESANVREIVTAATATTLANVGMGGGGCAPMVAIQLVGAQTYNPVEPARVAAYALSLANGSAPVFIARVMKTIAAP